MLRTIEIDLLYQPSIPGPPPQEGNLYQNACAGDGSTIKHWEATWLKNYKANSDYFGDFGDKAIGKLFGYNRHKPAIVIGSGPSLKYSVDALKENKKAKHPVLTVSCLHNYGYFEDEGCHADYYVSLDAGPIVVKDVYESRNQPEEHYWNSTKDKVLLAYAGSDPLLFEKWQGEILLFNSLIPDLNLRNKLMEIQPFTHYVSSGGNCLGAAMYIAKGVMGSSTIMYVGADFCFDYNNTFHAYKTQYDNIGQYVVHTDVFGNMRKTWQSYKNFKYFLDHVACTVPGEWINCSEGILGSYREGNIIQFKYCNLQTALVPYKAADMLLLQDKQTGTQKDFDLEEYWGNAKGNMHLTFF